MPTLVLLIDRNYPLLDYLKRALHDIFEHLDEEHEVTVPTYINLNSAYLAKGETDKAIEYGQKALKILLNIICTVIPT